MKRRTVFLALVAVASFGLAGFLGTYLDAATPKYIKMTSVKSGAEVTGSFAGNPQVATVTFSTAFSDANYSVSLLGPDDRGWTIDSQAAGSFVINTNAAQALTSSVSWTAIAHFDP